MIKWEYTLVLRRRTWERKSKDFYYAGAQWETKVNDEWKQISIDDYINSLGKDGWELVSVVAESSHLGEAEPNLLKAPINNIAGFTDAEKWIFKRATAEK